MKAILSPSIVEGCVTIPPSKSMAHRAIICASLSAGTSIIDNVDYSKDILATLEGMKALGASITMEERRVIITGVQTFHCDSEAVFCNESGSTLRFFIPIFSLCHQPITFTGSQRLLQRPQKVYEDLFKKQGLQFTQDEQGIHIKESLKAGEYSIEGNISSQFITGLLFTLPLLAMDSTIHIVAPFESRSYVDLTIEMLERFGVRVSYTDVHTLHIPGGQHYEACNYAIEGDYSQLAFFAVLAALNHDLDIKGVRHDSKQGDKEILSILKDFGAQIEEIEGGYRVHKSELHASEIDLANCPDLGPILTVLAMYSPGNTVIKNAERLRIKESDRIAAMEEELRKFGVEIHSTQGEIFITGGKDFTSTEVFTAHNDHRIVMALCVALLCSNSSGVIEEAQAINKSYPSFFDDIALLHGKVEYK